MEHESVFNMWKSYIETAGDDVLGCSKKYSSWYFCDNKHDADELARLVVEGTKRATASLFILYENEGESIPRSGDFSIITNWDGVAQCIIKTTKIDIVPFKDVTEDFAYIEGEGDKSLEYWKRAHWGYFSREMKQIGHEINDDVLVICEEFEVVCKNC